MGRPRSGDYTPKTCVQCGTTILREELSRRVSEAHWRTRRFCDAACRDAWSAEHVGDLPRRPPKPRDTKVCEQCGATFERRVTLNARWERQRFCSHECASAARRRTGDKVCERCGGTFVRPAQRSDATWEAQRFCAEACRRSALGDSVRGGGPDHPAWKGDAVGPMGGRHRARQLIPVLGPCNRCGRQAELRHHIDEDPTNNELQNLEQLCRDCHVKHHNPVNVRWRRSKG